MSIREHIADWSKGDAMAGLWRLYRLRERAGQITPEDQKRVDQALDVSLGLGSY